MVIFKIQELMDDITHTYFIQYLIESNIYSFYNI